MDTVIVEVQQDHIDRLAKAKKPIVGLAELIWTGFDADARLVTVVVTRNQMGAIQTIEVRDNGLGMSYREARAGFGGLGGSWKQHEALTRKEKRLVHGRQGQGRFRAFAVAEHVEWHTVYASNGHLKEFSIRADTADKRQFHFSDEKVSARTDTGTIVTLHDVVTSQSTLDDDKAVEELTKLFALYLKQYPKAGLVYDGSRVDPLSIQDLVTDYDLDPFETEDRRNVPAHLTVVEWKLHMERALYLCDANGFTLREMSAGIQARGYSFTAYLRSPLLAEMADAGTIDMEDFSDLRKLLEAAKETIREHFLKRDAEKAATVVEQWKQEDIYPYPGEPSSILEKTERQVFDVVAASVESYLPEFKSSKPKSRKLTFNLLKYAIESNPSALKRILEEVLGLPKEKQDEFAELLQRTSLSAVINAAKIVADRLEFLSGLDYFYTIRKQNPPSWSANSSIGLSLAIHGYSAMSISWSMTMKL